MDNNSEKLFSLANKPIINPFNSFQSCTFSSQKSLNLLSWNADKPVISVYFTEGSATSIDSVSAQIHKTLHTHQSPSNMQTHTLLLKDRVSFCLMIVTLTGLWAKWSVPRLDCPPGEPWQHVFRPLTLTADPIEASTDTLGCLLWHLRELLMYTSEWHTPLDFYCSG